jgi:cell wall-associated NlpC family hydrolase
VRQCIFDLRQEFGYTLGKWNQAYQFDLLPDEGLTEKDLKPGDLVFYSATYSNPKLKPFPHRMVHVEIYLGEGKSIGARWHKGTIQVFDSYKFKTDNYYDIEFHYRSIDSWLEGKFVSHCK